MPSRRPALIGFLVAAMWQLGGMPAHAQSSDSVVVPAGR
jgi:hypothetical protein